MDGSKRAEPTGGGWLNYERSKSMKWVHIKGSTYKCPNCGTRFIIRKKWVCCPVCGKKLSGVKEQEHK